MKPLRLTLQAFGSYGGELSIDFARLGRHGIFAISGPTGAGKSTIFDAMVYALYDDLPGFRIDGNIRSQYAGETTLTKVCFEFEVHGEEWRIERCPTQLVPRRRGSGLPTEKPWTVVLRRTGAESGGTTRKGEVAAKVEELIGLTKAQFEQVVLIPQGHFEEVLKVETKDRAPLLRRLFPVEVFTGVTESLRTIASERREAFDQATADRADVVDRALRSLGTVVARLPEAIASPFGEDELTAEGFEAERITEHAARVATIDSGIDGLVEAASTALDRARAEQDAAVGAAKQWEEWQANLADAEGFADQEEEDRRERTALDRAVTLRTLATSLDEWQAAAGRLSELGGERARIRASLDAGWIDIYAADALEQAASTQLLAERMRRDAGALQEAADEFERLLCEERELSTVRQKLERQTCDLGEARQALKERAEALEGAGKEIEQLRDQAATLDGLEATARAIEEELGRAIRREGADREVDRLTAEIAAAAEAVRRATETAAAIRAAWRHGLAGRLAQELADGEPCPTCGALDHPEPAVGQEEAPGDDELEAAEAEGRRAAEHVNELYRSLAEQDGIRAALAAARDRLVLERELVARQERLGQAKEAKRRLAVLVTSTAAATTTLQEDGEKADLAERRLAEDQGAFGGREQRFNQDRDAFVTAHGTFATTAVQAAATSDLAALLRDLHGVLAALDTAEGVHGRLQAALQPTVAAFEVEAPTGLLAWRLPDDQIEARQHGWEQRRDRCKEVRAKITAYDAGGGPRTRPDPAPFEVRLIEATSSHTDLIGRQAVIKEHVRQLAAAPGDLAAAAAEVDRTRTALQQAQTLADLCAGAGAGPVHTRLSLENWVLADYLRQVLRQANGRLATMTSGRYALELSDGQIDGRKQWGLELDAFDVNTGQTRPVRTLSGGETFMAALALALGLADVVAGSSNRNLGALFVDEGFGSLDPQSLDAVIEVLRTLEDGGRMVGIISHVEDLKQALPMGITVIASNTGSRAEIHYPPG